MDAKGSLTKLNPRVFQLAGFGLLLAIGLAWLWAGYGPQECRTNKDYAAMEAAVVQADRFTAAKKYNDALALLFWASGRSSSMMRELAEREGGELIDDSSLFIRARVSESEQGRPQIAVYLMRNGIVDDLAYFREHTNCRVVVR